MSLFIIKKIKNKKETRIIENLKTSQYHDGPTIHSMFAYKKK